MTKGWKSESIEEYSIAFFQEEGNENQRQFHQEFQEFLQSGKYSSTFEKKLHSFLKMPKNKSIAPLHQLILSYYHRSMPTMDCEESGVSMAGIMFCVKAMENMYAPCFSVVGSSFVSPQSLPIPFWSRTCPATPSLINNCHNIDHYDNTDLCFATRNHYNWL